MPCWCMREWLCIIGMPSAFMDPSTPCAAINWTTVVVYTNSVAIPSGKMAELTV